MEHSSLILPFFNYITISGSDTPLPVIGPVIWQLLAVLRVVEVVEVWGSSGSEGPRKRDSKHFTKTTH